MTTAVHQNVPSRAEDAKDCSSMININIPSSVATSPIFLGLLEMPVYPQPIETIREQEYPNMRGRVYLDHGGTQIPAKSALQNFSNDLINNLYGNPHSSSTPSAIAGHRVDAVRERMLHFFGADPAEFDLIFTANATSAIKLVVDCFRDYCAPASTGPGVKLSKFLRKDDSGGFQYLYHSDAHTSLTGPRENSIKGHCFKDEAEVEAWISSPSASAPVTLFAFPGQSNMTGRRLPLSWPSRIRSSGHKRVYTLLDAAALATTSPLYLSSVQSDFTCLSFYKIFGFPDLGALIVRKATAGRVLLSRKYFGGGTVDMVVSINNAWHAKKLDSLHDRLEDGTLAFHQIIALDHALNTHNTLYGGMHNISKHTAKLSKELYRSLNALRHTNGARMIEIYKDKEAQFGDPRTQGATVAFNVKRPDGSYVGYVDVEKAADVAFIYLRSGTHCNPGGIAKHLGWTAAEMRDAYRHGHRCSRPIQGMGGRATGMVRATLGACSTVGDVRALVAFLKDTYRDRNTEDAMTVCTPFIPAEAKSSPDSKQVSSAVSTTTNLNSLPNLTKNEDVGLSYVRPSLAQCEVSGGYSSPSGTRFVDEGSEMSTPPTTLYGGDSEKGMGTSPGFSGSTIGSHRLSRARRWAKSMADMAKVKRPAEVS